MPCLSHVQSEISGDWRLAPVAGSLGIGPNQGNISWWSNTFADVNTRSCLFDDIYSFDEDGNFSNAMGNSTGKKLGREISKDVVCLLRHMMDQTCHLCTTLMLAR